MTAPRPSTSPARGLLSALALAADTADEIVLGTVRDVHGAVARRVLGVTARATGGSSRPVEVVHERVSSAIYAGRRRRAPRDGTRAPRRRPPRDRVPHRGLARRAGPWSPPSTG